MKLQKALTVAAFGAALLLWPAQAPAQEKTQGAAMEMPKPGPEMEKWKWMVGKWRVTETHEKNDWSPGGPGKGTAVVTLGPGGFSHVMDYNSTGPTGKFAGRGITAWDPEAKVYRSVWTDSMTPGIMSMECREEGKDLVCSGESMFQGKKMAMRTRSANVSPAGWTEVFEMSMDGGPYQKAMTLEWKK